MKEEYTEKRRGWIIVLSIIAVLLIGVGIFFYYSFFRQSKSELIEAVPTDALFLYEVNDNTDFTKGITPLLTYFNELFAMDALPAYETIHNALPIDQYDITISGHPIEGGIALLFNTHIDQNNFRKLLKSLSIDPANFESFEQQKIYTYGTNFKNLRFVYFNHILSVTTSKDLLKKAIIQHRHPKNLLSEETFHNLYNIAEKNKKQNWLFINDGAYCDYLDDFFAPEVVKKIQKFKSMTTWSAFQLRFSQNEILLSGYTSTSATEFDRLKGEKADAVLPEDVLPYHTNWYYKMERSDYNICRVGVAPDSVKNYEYLLIHRDSLGHGFNPFGTAQRADEMAAAYPNNIFPLSDSVKVPTSSSFDSSHYSVFTIKGNYYIFATSEEALNAFGQDLSTNNTISQNRYYKFSKSNIASSNVIEYTYYNTTEGRPLLKKMSAKGKATHFGHDMAIFSISCSDITDEYASVNIYVNFVK
ncbi:MAG: hypothetical protein K5636_03855 [Bacteroidales bacterium]|nr:hypothetical protein [Bacteroidales bacterium]